jgi:hypothetical protein
MNKTFTNITVPWDSGNQIIEHEDSSFMGFCGVSSDKKDGRFEGL